MGRANKASGSHLLVGHVQAGVAVGAEDVYWYQAMQDRLNQMKDRNEHSRYSTASASLGTQTGLPVCRSHIA